MSNWFEDNPTKSIVSYTLVVIAATWAASYFVIDENKINLYKSQVDNERSVNRQLEAKIGVLEGKILDLSNENKQLKEWLSGESTSYPALINKIHALEKELSERPRIASSEPKNTNEFSDLNKLYSYSENFVMGQSFTDPLTNATIGVSQIASDYTADIYLFLPGKESLEKKGVKPGSSWVYEFEKKQYKLTLNKIEWIGSSLKATVVEM